jgi:SRSO17 transposase
MGQVGVALGYYAANIWSMVDAELYLPEVWFGEEHKKRFHRLHIPEDRTFRTKAEIGLQLIDRAVENRLPFSRFSSDAFYGKDFEFRAGLDKRKIPYLVDISSGHKVYLEEPTVGVPPRPKGKQRANI